MIPVSKSSGGVKSAFEISLEKFATTLRADFRFAPLNALILVGIFVAGLAVQLTAGSAESTTIIVALYLGTALVLAVKIRFTQVWEAVEIRDIIIPKGLEDAMSRQAQAERERQSRIILGTAETEIAEKFARASDHYKDNPVALHLRAMNMVYEGLRQKGSMIIVPSSAVESMGLGALGGLTAFGKEIPKGGEVEAKSSVQQAADGSTN